MDKIEKRILSVIEEHAEEIIAYGRDLWEHAELGFHEQRTAAKFAKGLERLGIRTQRGIAVTGVKGVIGEEGPTVALMGELDGLPMPGHPSVNPETGAAHGCGHNCQTAAVLGAAMALSDPEILRALGGRVAFCATPAEEGISLEELDRLRREGKIGYSGGKSEWIRIGAMDDIDIMIGCHGCEAPGLMLVNCSCSGFVSKRAVFHGRSAHAASDPQEGIDAQAAANLAQAALDANRLTFNEKDGIRIHSCIRSTDGQPNTIASRVELEYSIRAKTKQALQSAEYKVQRCIEAAAMATGCGAKCKTYTGYLPWVPMKSIAVIEEAVQELDSEKYPVGKVEGYVGGSSDCADVAAIMPMYQIHAGGYQGKLHSNDLHLTDEYLAYVHLAKALALSVYHLLKNGGEKAREVLGTFHALMTREEYAAYKRSFDREDAVERKPVPDFGNEVSR